jgi:DNA-directed RNA polymerase specialized sigma24 family protein
MPLLTSAIETMDGREELAAANDPLLQPLFVAASDAELRSALDAILASHVLPTVRRIVQRQSFSDRSIGAEDAEDITSTVALKLFRRLQRIPFERELAIDRLGDFTATTTYNVIHDFLRGRFPERERLRNRVRYVLTHDARFRATTSAAGPLCSLSSWPDAIAIGRMPTSWQHDDPSDIASAIESLLLAAGGPLLVSDVLRALAECWNISESRSVPASEIAQDGESHDAHIEGKQRLEALWREIRALPAQQRAALLLNLRDADGSTAIALFSLMGIASVNEVASAIELPVRQLAKLWPRLPLDDLTIAPILGVTRQQVINLRLAARQRLARRLKKW